MWYWLNRVANSGLKSFLVLIMVAVWLAVGFASRPQIEKHYADDIRSVTGIDLDSSTEKIEVDEEWIADEVFAIAITNDTPVMVRLPEGLVDLVGLNASYIVLIHINATAPGNYTELNILIPLEKPFFVTIGLPGVVSYRVEVVEVKKVEEPPVDDF